MRELYHINRLLTLSEDKTQSGDWEIQDTLANANDAGVAVVRAPAPPAPAAAPALAPAAPPEKDHSWCDSPATEIQEEPSYWVNVSKEMAACEDHYQLARILGWLSCRFAFMNAAVQCSISMVEFTLQELELVEDYSKPSQRRLLKGIMNGAGLKLRIQLLESNLRHMIVFGAIGPRMQTQQTVVSRPRCLDGAFVTVFRGEATKAGFPISCSTSSTSAWQEIQKKWPKQASVIVRR